MLGINHFQEIAGSEILVLEFAEFFSSLNIDTTICANFIGNPMLQIAARSNINVCLASQDINALDFDLVISINHIGPILDYTRSKSNAFSARFVFLHVDLNFCLSQPGLVCEPLLADEVWLHSNEAYDHFSTYSLPLEKLDIFYNAVPHRFWVTRPYCRSNISDVTIISNYIPNEVLELIEILKLNNIGVVHYGKNSNNYGRIGPKAILNADVVISIGKTVQYCLASRTPIFVYDHFAGPSYLNDENFANACYHNFSGRCSPMPREASKLFHELIDGYLPAVKFSRDITDQKLAKFKLRPRLLSLLGVGCRMIGFHNEAILC